MPFNIDVVHVSRLDSDVSLPLSQFRYLFCFLLFFLDLMNEHVTLPYLNTPVGPMDHTIIGMLPSSLLFPWLNCLAAANDSLYHHHPCSSLAWRCHFTNCPFAFTHMLLPPKHTTTLERQEIRNCALLGGISKGITEPILMVKFIGPVQQYNP